MTSLNGNAFNCWQYPRRRLKGLKHGMDNYLNLRNLLFWTLILLVRIRLIAEKYFGMKIQMIFFWVNFKRPHKLPEPMHLISNRTVLFIKPLIKLSSSNVDVWTGLGATGHLVVKHSFVCKIAT